MRYQLKQTSLFKKQLKKIIKRGKNLNKMTEIINHLLAGETLEEKYKDHSLIDNKTYKNCRECHIEPNWLLVYRYNNDKLILLLVETGSHSDLFKK